MLSEQVAAVDPAQRTAGGATVAQGVYGARGNLELIACDQKDGLWVFWFNADRESDPPAAPDVPPGTWSSGLAFAHGVGYRDAWIAQSPLGPDHLEALALRADGVLESWYWSPRAGFQRRPGPVATAASSFRAVHHDGSVLLELTDEGGRTRHLLSTPNGYPARSWRETRSAFAAADPAADLALLISAGVDPAAVAVDTLRSAPSTRAGGTVEVIWRDPSGRLHHLGVPRSPATDA
ncbi:hypothetical protein ACF1AJ_19100 [Leifsonia sp. NPDC014704]|uniref:Uncharacterized protein n=1 Tax=Leifsonia virtsii TaxID=3035915 RepID=A0ABT8J526_9MICO|nr:hypothetical protein [Leifsonia virtsii]MDN4599369.1 hypothetical protein [Leifsonia virtsii]